MKNTQLMQQYFLTVCIGEVVLLFQVPPVIALLCPAESGITSFYEANPQ